MPKPKRPSMLTRQRQLRAQQQQVRNASRNNLPPQGGTGGGRGGAVAPRSGSAPVQRGGALAQSSRGRAVDGRVEPVRVRVEAPRGSSAPKPMGGTPPRALPPGAAGGALARRTPGGGISEPLIGIEAGRALGNAIAPPYIRAIKREQTDRWRETGGQGRYSPRGQQVGGGMGGVSNIPPAEGRLNNPNYGKPGVKPAPSRPSSPAPSRSSAPAPSKPAAPKPAAPAQSKNMDENYAAWAKANQGLAAKVKPNQAGYAAVKKTLDELKIKNKSKK